MVAIRQVEDPEQRHLVIRRGILLPADRPVEAAAPELRLALRARVAIDSVAFKHLDDLLERLQGIDEMLRPDEIEVVGGRVIFGKVPFGDRIRQPTGRLNPGEQYCRSS